MGLPKTEDWPNLKLIPNEFNEAKQTNPWNAHKLQTGTCQIPSVSCQVITIHSIDQEAKHGIIGMHLLHTLTKILTSPMPKWHMHCIGSHKLELHTSIYLFKFVIKVCESILFALQLWEKSQLHLCHTVLHKGSEPLVFQETKCPWPLPAAVTIYLDCPEHKPQQHEQQHIYCTHAACSGWAVHRPGVKHQGHRKLPSQSN